MNQRARAALGTTAGVHFLHDGFSEILYVLLPVWAAEFHLSFAQVGVIRTAYTGGMAALQIPVGLLAERWGERRLLATGTAVTALGFIVVGWAGGFLALLACLLAAGLASSVQHPLASSIVSKAYETGPRRAALGTYNFSGDVGKAAIAAGVGLLAALIGWRAATAAYGVLGLLAAVAIAVVLGRLGIGAAEHLSAGAAVPRGGWGIRDGRGFSALTAIGMIDNATRTGFLTFIGFVLIAKGSSVAGVGLALALVFAGGATGKFVCGLIADRVGVIRTVVFTEAATTLGILVVLVSPLAVALVVLVPLGVALNGTSSVLYGTVADLVLPERRSRAYGLYYTLTMIASSLSPALYGVASDAVGVPATLVIVASIVLVTIPLCLVLRPVVTAPASA